MTSYPSFDDFYRSVHDGREPFRWQSRLAEEVLERGWPALLDLPTGAGKTSTLDVALYTLAVAPERMPRRTLLVVDRRIVVDQGAMHARALLSKLNVASAGPALAIAGALRALSGAGSDEPPFLVATMRGGMPRDNDWARRPDQPVLGVSTVDQIGSRLLFRGYGSSDRSASIHAGLLGNDTLILLDEVHLAEPFAQTLEALSTTYRSTASALPDRFRVVRMSATAGKIAAGTRVFGLAADDRDQPVLARRLSATKLGELAALKVTGDDEDAKRAVVAQAAVQHSLALQRAGARVVGVVVNRVDTARQALASLRTQNVSTTDAELVTGRMRPIDRDDVVRRVLLPRCGSRQDRPAESRPLVLVATQCIEAGADLDFDGLVTECASLDALRQRFGRLDRQGLVGKTHAVVLGRSDLVSGQRPDPIYGAALAATWQWLGAHARDGAVDFGIDALNDVLGGTVDESLLAPRPNAPVLLPAHIDAWAQTSPRPDFDPDISLWLHGPEKPSADVQIVWRADLGLPADADARALAETLTSLSACRPSTLEAISVPFGAARRWLEGAAPSEIADVLVGEPSDTEDSPRRKPHDEPQEIVALRWRGEDSEWVRANEIRPGDVLVVPCSRGGIRDGSFDPASTAPVLDVSMLAVLRARGQIVLSGTPGTLDCLGVTAEEATAMPMPQEDESPKEHRERLRDWAARLPDEPRASSLATVVEWRSFVEVLRRRVAARKVGSPERPKIVLSVPKRLLRADVDDLVTEDDDSSFAAEEVTLSRHSEDTRGLAERFARAIGFGEYLVADLGRAAWLHDVGKADPRFQRWLVGGSEVRATLLSEPLAKSALPAGARVERELARRRAGYPRGYRHELLSLALANSEGSLDGVHDRDLVLHLVASHHGFCRPFAPLEDHPEDEQVSLNHGGIELRAGTRHRFARLDSEVSDRFFRLVDRYGWWGLAWLEAVLRLADHRASEGGGGDR